MTIYKDIDKGECVVLWVYYGGLMGWQADESAKISKILVYRRASNACNTGNTARKYQYCIGKGYNSTPINIYQ